MPLNKERYRFSPYFDPESEEFKTLRAKIDENLGKLENYQLENLNAAQVREQWDSEKLMNKQQSKIIEHLKVDTKFFDA